MKTFTILFFLFFIFHLNGKAQIIHVPADYPTIQEGIAAAQTGDTVLVADGLYFENIDFLGKRPLMVASHFLMDSDTNHINNTIINGSLPANPDIGSVVLFISGEDTTSVLCGFTITGGSGLLISEVPFRGGGGAFIASGAKLLNNHFISNEVIDNVRTNGGAIWGGSPYYPNAIVVLRNNTISYNKAISYGDEGDGGGFDIFCNVILENNKISYNEANGLYRGDGGGGRIIANSPTQVTVKNNQVIYNKAISVSAETDLVLSGGLDFWGNCQGVVSGNNISFNEAEVPVSGGWCYGTGVLVELDGVKDPDFLFENNIVNQNTFSGDSCVGGGICVFTSGGKFQNNIIQNNEGTHGGGIAIEYNTDTNQVIMVNNTLTGNTATRGGGMYIESGNVVVINSIIWGNDAQWSPSIYPYQQSTLEVVYSDVESDDVWSGDGNINEDPGFLDDLGHIDENSPCEDMGTDDYYFAGNWYIAPEADFEGTPRPYDDGFDIGADECNFITGLYENSPDQARTPSVRISPNPVFSKSEIKYQISESKNIGLKVLDICGRVICTLVDEVQAPGEHVVHFDATPLPDGIYFLRLQAGDRVETVKVVVMK
jgi:hypothetical protein